MRSISRIAVLGDVLRPTTDNLIGGVDDQINWLFHAVRRQVQSACSLPVSVITSRGTPEIAAALALLRRPDDFIAFWAAHFDRAPTGIEQILAECVQDCFCICYELPPYLAHLLDRLGVPYLDWRVHPVRFMDDLVFAARSSHPGVQQALMQLAVTHAEVIAQAGLREAMLRLIEPARLPPDTLLVIGQLRWDSSQIIDGEFFNPATCLATIEQLCRRHRHVAVKPHPHGGDVPLLDIVRTLRPDCVTVSDNVYRLLACPQLGAVLTVNSSVAVEAGLFGVPCHTLAPQPVQVGWRGAAADAHAAIDDCFLTADFWRTVLRPYCAVSPDDGFRLPRKPNRVRLALNAFWNYQQIDTDLIPRTASPPAPEPAPTPTPTLAPTPATTLAPTPTAGQEPMVVLLRAAPGRRVPRAIAASLASLTAVLF